jgi:single-stranded DNA-binding protein
MYGDFSFQFVGTVAQDREYGQMKNGQDRATINVAINTPRKNRDTGEFEEVTTWVRVAVFGERVRSASVDRCVKGMPVFMRGTIQSYQHEFGDQKFTMYNFRPDIIRPLMSVEQVTGRAERRGGQGGRGYQDDPPPPRMPPASEPMPPPAPSAPGPASDALYAPLVPSSPGGPPPPEGDDSGSNYFDD